MVMEHARSAGKVEPRVLVLLEVGDPPFAGIAVGEGCGELFLVLGACHLLGYAQLECQARKPPELVVGA